jgi:hypothetical protein
MGYSAKGPAWGVLAKCSADEVRKVLAPLSQSYDLGNFMYRTKDGWTAVFNMQAADTADEEAAVRLQQHGLIPVYRFDFSKYEWLTSRWDGTRWLQDRDPADVLGGVGIAVPGWESKPAGPDPRHAISSREAVVIEGASVDEVRQIAPGKELRVEEGPLGAIIYEPEMETRFLFWERAHRRVFEFLFYPDSGKFRFRIVKGEECLGTFKPGETRSWDGTPFLASVEGATTAANVIDKFGIAPAFLDRHP